jgi:hypothetical protein
MNNKQCDGVKSFQEINKANPSGTLGRLCVFYLDVELQVLIHGVDVVEYVRGNSRDDAHPVVVVELTLGGDTRVK